MNTSTFAGSWRPYAKGPGNRMTDVQSSPHAVRYQEVIETSGLLGTFVFAPATCAQVSISLYLVKHEILTMAVFQRTVCNCL